MNPTTLLRTEATDALIQSPLPALRDLLVSETDAEVVISGCVNSYYLKQLAQETVRHALAGRRLFNRVKVLRAV